MHRGVASLGCKNMQNPIIKNDREFLSFVFPNGFSYDVEWERMKTERDINEWIAHLAKKNWWSEQLENELIKLWKEKYEMV